MHRALVTAIIALTSGSAMASSIEYVDGVQVSNGSFTPVKCVSCPPLKERTKPDTYAIPSIAPGTQQTEMREINGHKEMIRTEAWLGGAPVTFVTKNPAWLPLEDAGTAIAGHGSAAPATSAPETAATGPVGIDASATTGAIKAGVASGGTDFSDFKLRTE
ncbi:plant virulence effector HPE1-like domain-containing protein [Agrobacterium sp. NPDC090273]|uniref:plant virulence effector HPE1-like domain-containing protein n=1 Tax=Agrobacterium sp. NPDC090273 TaxID=3363919 RepID=UPI00383B6336